MNEMTKANLSWEQVSKLKRKATRGRTRPGSGGRPERLKRGERGDPDAGLAARVPSEAAWGPTEFSHLQVGRAR